MATNSVALRARSAEDIRRLLFSEFGARFALVVVAVVVCYLFQWNWLRWITSELNLRLDVVFGVHLQRLTFDTVAWRGAVYRYVVACTFADVFCGAIPLLWNRHESVVSNVFSLVVFGELLIAFNVLRLSFSDVLFATGLSWNLAHNVVSGFSYFLVWKWIWQNQKWSKQATRVSKGRVLPFARVRHAHPRGYKKPAV